jgi:subtilisin-like proprotein convertase family protein
LTVYNATACTIAISQDVPVFIEDFETSYSVITIVNLLCHVLNNKILQEDPRFVYSVEIIKFNVVHDWTGDLFITLLSPNNESVVLFDSPCDSGDDLTIEKLSDQGRALECPPEPTAVYSPESPLSTFRGTPMQGQWTLAVTDTSRGDTGVLQRWGIKLCIGKYSPFGLLYLNVIRTSKTQCTHNWSYY